ncbi:bifunctional demethylmenaquinone methyltransferase/2-methoxy-6-polyprenyl-1,4-benzoquinol methylase UbiE [Tumidithrix helvetica PCC 7403]|uniref:bifunctional demethylmenaquinone methyltransferase/2-methoxy-6-polyprenyl-1,4-benzoquinol methylase UbiE n=1 Tax=Tumidithrix helvetica TaxID=3457545 RepID=UPI003C9C8A58
MPSFTSQPNVPNSTSATEVRQIFNRIAPIYDRLNDWLSLGQHRIWKKMAVSWGNPQLGQTWLDLCCGSGDVAALLARRVAPTGHVFGVDFSKELLAIAAQKHAPSIQKSITWQEGDALALDFADATFDGATIAYGLRNVIDIPKCFAELHRVLKTGANVAILDFHRPSDPTLVKFQEFYLANIVVPMAKQQNVEADYAYIAPSIERFPIGSEQVKLAKNAGFSQATHYPIVNGMMGILVLQK